MTTAVNYLLLIVLLLAGCSSENKKKETRTVFRYNEASGISSLDPAFAKGQADIWACNQLYNGLVQMNDQLEVKPSIASHWNISADGKSYTFFLRDSIYFHNNAAFGNSNHRKVTAHDFVYSFNRILDPALASPGNWVFNYVQIDTATKKASFTAVSDSEFVITLKQPFPPFLGLLTSMYCSVVPYEAIEKYGKEFRTHPVGTGPFRYHLWVERTNLILWKNPEYFEFENGERLPFVDAVSVSFINDRQSAFLEFVKGNLDFVSGIDASYKDELLTRKGGIREKYRGRFHLETCPYLNTEYLGILAEPVNGMKSPLLDKRIRKAINYGFDRQKMITYLRNGIGDPGIYGIVPPGLPSFDTTSVKGYSYNPDSTAFLLAQAGFPGGKGLPVITMSTTREYQDLCEFMQGQLAESGIIIKLEVNQGATHREMVARQKLEFFRGSWIADYPDAENYLSLFYSKNFAPAGPNYTHFKNEQFDLLYENASSVTDDSARYNLYRQMDQIIIDNAPVVILYYDQVVRLYANEITGLGKNGMNLLNIKRVKKSRT
jgi:oligopeptide transport system substrate-binding protein